MRAATHWRRFRSRLRGKLDDKTLYESDSLYARARQIAHDAYQSTRGRVRGKQQAIKRASMAAAMLRDRQTRTPEYLLARLLLLVPAAAAAQDEMDRHYGGYKNRKARLYELIDFNDTFVDTVLALPEEELTGFTQRLRTELNALCAKLRVDGFDDDQFDAIVHGLSREIAVYRGAKKEGYQVRMTSRVQDAKGVDMIITDPRTKKSIGVDVKTHSSFHFRLLKLQRRNLIDEQRRLECELAGFCTIRNTRRSEQPDTVLLRIATSRLGPIANYSFRKTDKLAALIAGALKNHGKYIV